MSDQTPKDLAHPSGPAQVGKLTVTVDRDLCIGAATCMAIAPHTFLIDSEAKAIILSTGDSESEDTVMDAARGCPTSAITIKDESGNQVFPK